MCTCGSNRIARIGAKCSDLCYAEVSHLGLEKDGYVPVGIGIDDGGDYVDFDYCLDCGQLQGEFPISDSQVKKAFSGDF